MLWIQGERLRSRVDDVTRSHVCESDGRQLLFARCPRLGANEPGARVNNDGEARFPEKEVHCAHREWLFSGGCRELEGRAVALVAGIFVGR